MTKDRFHFGITFQEKKSPSGDGQFSGAVLRKRIVLNRPTKVNFFPEQDFLKKGETKVQCKSYQVDQSNLSLIKKQNKDLPRQQLSHVLLRAEFLSCNEIAILGLINTFSHHCILRVSEISRKMGKSPSTVKRTLRSLELKGMIIKRYGNYKRLILRIVSLERQKEILDRLKRFVPVGFQMMRNALEKSAKKFRRGIYRSRVTHSKEERNKNTRIHPKTGGDKPFGMKSMAKSMTDSELSMERQRQIRTLLEMRGLSPARI